MQRRTVLKLVALSALRTPDGAWASPWGVHLEERAAWTAADYQLQYFTAAEIALLDQVMELIIPADQHSGGAKAARVSFFADRMVSTSGEDTKTRWRQGLEGLRAAAAESSLAEALERAAAGEAHPQTEPEQFFVALKSMTINGYYSSEIGIHQDLEYQGNTYVAEFPGCTD